MDKNVCLAVVMVFLIVVCVSDASLYRMLEGLVVPHTKHLQGSPSPSPVPGETKPDPKSTVGSKNSEPVPPVPDKPTEGEQGNLSGDGKPNGGSKVVPDKPTKDAQKDLSGDGKPNGGSEAGSTDKCELLDPSCEVKGLITACVKYPHDGSKELVLLVHNIGESIVQVNLTMESQILNKPLEVPKDKTEKFNISQSTDKSSKLILNTGKGDCVIHLGPPGEGSPFLRLPSYEKLVTPVNGAYVLILTMLVFGGTWACCKFRKKRHHGGVPYQELEMGSPESGTAVNVETAEGWDEGWDDDWDEDSAVKSVGRNVASISANGLTSRSSNRE